jgi:glutathione S-transferase
VKASSTPSRLSPVKLYYTPGACSLAVHIALRELELAFQATAVDLTTHTTADGDNYHDISPRGYVPLLELADGSRHTEVGALLQHLADLDPAQALIGPVGSARRLAVTQWVTFVGTELHKAFSPWLWHKETADSTRKTVRARIATHLAELDALLSRQEYLAGDFSIADAYAYTIINWANVLMMTLAPYPSLKAYLVRVAQRPRVHDALRAEGLLK